MALANVAIPEDGVLTDELQKWNGADNEIDYSQWNSTGTFQTCDVTEKLGEVVFKEMLKFKAVFKTKTVTTTHTSFKVLYIVLRKENLKLLNTI